MLIWKFVYCRDNDGNVIPNARGIIAGRVTSVEITVMVKNTGDESFAVRINVDHSNVLRFNRAVFANEVSY